MIPPAVLVLAVPYLALAIVVLFVALLAHFGNKAQDAAASNRRTVGGCF